MLNRFLALVLIAVIAFFGIAPTTYAVPLSQSPSMSYETLSLDTESPEQSLNPIEKCLFSQPETGIGEVVCGASKDIAREVISYVGIGAIAGGVCYAADGLATAVFPPAAVVAPFCSSMGEAIIILKSAKKILAF